MAREKKNQYRIFYGLMGLFCISLISCGARMTIIPPTGQVSHFDFQIKGNVIYEGDKVYFPRVIIEEPDSKSGLTFHYVYHEAYETKDVPDICALFNPLNFIGFPTGESTLKVEGKLDILKGKEIVKSYNVNCALEKTRNLYYEGETFSEMRAKGLIAVRDNIESQMWQDRDFLRKLLVD